MHQKENPDKFTTVSPQPPNFTPKLPYSYYDNEESDEWGGPPRGVLGSVRSMENVLIKSDFLYVKGSRKHICAQDVQTHEVMIKAVPRNSDEHRIYELLKATPCDEESFCYILPTIDILDYDDKIVFAVTPRRVVIVPSISISCRK